MNWSILITFGTIIACLLATLKIVDYTLVIVWAFRKWKPGMSWRMDFTTKVHPAYLRYWYLSNLLKKLRLSPLIFFYKFPVIILFLVLSSHIATTRALTIACAFFAVVLVSIAILHRVADLLTLGYLDLGFSSVKAAPFDPTHIERPSNIGDYTKKFLMIFLLLLCLVILIFSNCHFLIWRNCNIAEHYTLSPKVIAADFFEKVLYAVYFSTTTTLTIGFGDIVPLSSTAVAIVLVQEIASFFLLVVLFTSGVALIPRFEKKSKNTPSKKSKG